MRLAREILLLLGATAVLAAGCGDNVCEAYVESYFATLKACGEMVQDTDADAVTFECTDARARQAECLEECLPVYDCACELDGTGAGCDEKLAGYNACVDACFF